MCISFLLRWGGVPLKDAIRGRHTAVQRLLRESGAKTWLVLAEKGQRNIVPAKSALCTLGRARNATLRSCGTEDLIYPRDVRVLVEVCRGKIARLNNLCFVLGREEAALVRADGGDIDEDHKQV